MKRELKMRRKEINRKKRGREETREGWEEEKNDRRMRKRREEIKHANEKDEKDIREIRREWGDQGRGEKAHE